MEKNYRVVFPEKCKVVLEEREVPQIGENELLLKTIVTQISTGTELTRLEQNFGEGTHWDNMAWYLTFPIYPGYSTVAEIVEVGEKCDKSLLGKKIVGGGYHEKYMVVPGDAKLTFLPDNVDPDDAVFATLSVVALASIRAAKIKPGETVVVYGAGIVGQLVARLAQIAGAVNVVVADVSDYRLDFVPKNKCFYTVNSSKDDVAEFVKGINNGELADVLFETTGYAPILNDELHCLTKLGRCVITSSPTSRSDIDFQYCSGRGITIVAAQNMAIHPPVATPHNPWTVARDYEYTVQLLEKELTSFKGMVTHKENYKNAVAMYELLMKDRTKALAVHLDWRD